MRELFIKTESFIQLKKKIYLYLYTPNLIFIQNINISYTKKNDF